MNYSGDMFSIEASKKLRPWEIKQNFDNGMSTRPDLDLVRPQAKKFDEAPFMGTGLPFRRPIGRVEKINYGSFVLF